MIQSYKKNPIVADHYDTIVIDSGIGSMATAAILSKEGPKVLVLERHIGRSFYNLAHPSKIFI
jgi:all-trans-retinol 13,14-reductase